jgi:predicted peroxiredoxin
MHAHSVRKWAIHLGFGSLLILASAGCQTAGPGGGQKRDGVFIHLHSGPQDPHAVVMALRMAQLMSAERDVLVYCDLNGINVVLAESPDITYPTFESSRAQLKALLAADVPIYACPGCLRAAGRQPVDLLPGVRVAEKDAFFNFTAGRILTLDY